MKRKTDEVGFSGNALGFGRTNPTQNLVESFPMKDGKMPGDSKYAYNPMNNPYVDRDARLNYTILHNGSTWLGKQLETYQGELITQAVRNIVKRVIICVSLWGNMMQIERIMMVICFIYG